MTSQSWREHAACKGMHPDVFQVTRKSGTEIVNAVARETCAVCPVDGECLDWALEVVDKWAFLGGKTPDERYRLRRAGQRKARREGEAAA